MTSKNSYTTLVAHLPLRDDSSSTATGLVQPRSLSLGGDNSASDDGIVTVSSNPSVMTEQCNDNASSSHDCRGASIELNDGDLPMSGSQLLDALMGHERMQEEAFEAQLVAEPMEPESPVCSIRTERSSHTICSKNVHEKGRTLITDIDANETADEIELSQHHVATDLQAMTTVYGDFDSPPPLPSTSTSSQKNLKEFLSQFRQLSKSERRKLLGEVKTILDVGDKSMISGMDGYGYGYGRRMSGDVDEDDSLLASSEDGTAMGSRISSYNSETSTAFYTNDVSTAFFTADTRTTMHSTAADTYTSDDDNHVRYARKCFGGGGKRRGDHRGRRARAALASARGRKAAHSRLYEDEDRTVEADYDDDDDEDDADTLFTLFNVPCMSYLLCDFKHETKGVNLPETTTHRKEKEYDDDEESWDWNKHGKKKLEKRSEKVDTTKQRQVEQTREEEQNGESGGARIERCDSGALTYHSGLTVKERMAKLEGKLTGKKSHAEQEPVTADSLIEELRRIDDAEERNTKVEHDHPTITNGDKEPTVDDNETNDGAIEPRDGVLGDSATDTIAVVAEDLESKLELSSQENELVGIEADATAVVHDDNAPSTDNRAINRVDMAVLENLDTVPVVKSRQRSESPFIKAMATLSRKSSRLDKAGESELTQERKDTVTLTSQRSASPFVNMIPILPRKASRLNEVQPVDESIGSLPLQANEQAEGPTCCNNSSATEVSDDSAEVPRNEEASGGNKNTLTQSTKPVPASMKTVQLSPPLERQQDLAGSSIELVHEVVDQKPPRAQKKRFALPFFGKKKKSISRTYDSPIRNKKENEPAVGSASPVVTVRSVESSDSPTIPTTPTKFEYQEKTDLADVMYMANRDSPVSTSTTSSATSKKKRRGWKEYTDLTTGEKYYSDGVTTTWIRPVNFSRGNSPVTTNHDEVKTKTSKRGKKKGWRKYIDQNTGKPYYSDGITTSWEKPVSLEQ